MSTPRYRNLGDGTIRETHSGVYWMAVPLGFPETVRRRWRWPAWLRRLLSRVSDRRRPTEGIGVYTWDEAWQAVEAFNRSGGHAGYQDWRLPTRGELKRLLDPAAGWPRQSGTMPDAPAGRFWSSHPYAANPRYAWCVEAATGRAGYLSRSAPLHVWLVRNGRRAG